MRTTLRNFRAEDFEESVEKADRAAERNRRAAERAKSKSKSKSKDEPSNEDTSAETSNEDSNEVPEGSAKEILNWVGDDQDRAQRALDVENSNDEPRTSLVPKLEKIAEGKKSE